jgi:hypothetical protein
MWANRNCPYKFGFFCLVVGVLAYALGHVAQFWLRQEAVLYTVPQIPAADLGIWFACSEGVGCGTLSNDAGKS